MAIKWAVLNNVNWNTGSTWNDGVVPVDGDYVYLNGNRVNYSGSLFFDGTISNEANDDIGVISGGYLDVYEYNAGSITQVTTFIAETRILNLRHGTSTTRTETVIFNDFFVKFSGSAAITNTMNFLITGNVHLETGSSYLLQTSGTVTINGNITSVSSGVISSSTISNLTVNGNIESSVNASTATINGNINASLNNTVNANALTIFGNITYLNNSGGLGVKCTSLTVINPDTFTWKDISEPRINPFIIVTDWDLNNQVQYPPENRVVAGTPYAFDEKVGTFAVDYPQEAEVLQGVVYDNGVKVGTLPTVVLGDYPAESDVKVGVEYDYGEKIGTFQPDADYPIESDVRAGVEYAYNQMTGTLSINTDYPQEATVLQGVEYDFGHKTGTLQTVEFGDNTINIYPYAKRYPL